MRRSCGRLSPNARANTLSSSQGVGAPFRPNVQTHGLFQGVIRGFGNLGIRVPRMPVRGEVNRFRWKRPTAQCAMGAGLGVGLFRQAGGKASASP